MGERQAEAVAKRLAVYGVDRIFSSTSKRAKLTAKPLCELLKKDMTLLEFANEKFAWEELVCEHNNQREWLFDAPEMRKAFADEKIRMLRHKWYECEQFSRYKKGVERIDRETDNFMKSLGYEHIRSNGCYKVLSDNNERVALFAHQGFGIAFLSSILDIPYPEFSIHFDMGHTGMTAIQFVNEDGYAIPKILTLSNDSHIYKENLPLNYQNKLRF